MWRCSLRITDNEGMHGVLAAQGHSPVASAGDADVVIVNTCSFIAAAREETLGVLHEVAAGKAPGQRLVAAGCMAESHAAIVRGVPGVDAILSTREWMRIDEVIGPGARGQGSGVRGQGSGVRGQGSGARGQGPGARGQGPGVRG